MNGSKMGSNEKEEKMSLVLTLFKGENIVCKSPIGYRIQIEAKCCDQVLNSGVFNISSTNSEPHFNFQLAWQFTRRQLKELRGNKVPVKVRCLLVNENNGRKSFTELGYTILHVKDAFPWSGGEVEASKARSYPLLGTKEQWKDYHPRLLMQLHIEDFSFERLIASPNVQRKVINEVNSSQNKPKITPEKQRFENIDAVDKTPRVDVIPEIMNSNDKFVWRINDQDGCFQLGQKAEGDDLYILNVTILSVGNLHLLWNGRSPKKPASDDYVWQIKYKAYGCEIKSDPFILSQVDPMRRTFIGDKATARIRACAPHFCDYLQETLVEFQVVRFQLSANQDLVNEEVMGVSFADLKDLARSDVNELHSTLDVVSEWGYPKTINPSEKTEIELRVVFHLDATPAFFNAIKIPESTSSEYNDANENEIHQTIHTTETEEQPTVLISRQLQQQKQFQLADHRTEDTDTIDHIRDDMNELSLAERRKKTKEQDEKEGCQSSETVPPSVPSPIASSRPNRFSEDDVRDFFNSKDPNQIPQYIEDRLINTSNDIESESPVSKSDHKRLSNNSETSHGFSLAEKLPYLPLDPEPTSSCSSETSKENLHMVVPKPGTYRLTISLYKIWMKRREQFTSDIVLSYIHPKFHIFEPTICTATPSDEIRSPSKPYYRCLEVVDGVTTFEVTFNRFSEKIINEPLTVEFRAQTEKVLEPMFAFSMIPIGNVLLQSEELGMRLIKGTADVLKIGANVKIGKMHYDIEFASTTLHLNSPSKAHHHKLRESTKMNLSPLKKIGRPNRDNVYVPSEMVFETTNDLRMWKAEKKAEYDRELREKEKAYLKVLAKEAAARDIQREKLMTEKFTDLTKKEKELRQLSVGMVDREEQLRRKELELYELNQKVNLENTATLENAKLSTRRMQEEHKIEISCLRRRNQEFANELQKCKAKLEILEGKLEDKEAYVNKLKEERYERPDSRLFEKLKLLEQENKLLKKQIFDIERSRDQYKKQTQTICLKLARLQEDRDKQLKCENENLRLQILASKEHKELKKDRKAVADIAQQIRTIQDNTCGGSRIQSEDHRNETKKQERLKQTHVVDTRATDPPASNEPEILRLTSMRSGLLHTRAYTQHDMVIKELERRIVGLATEDGKLGE